MFVLQAIDRGEVVNNLAFSSLIERKLGEGVRAHVVCWKSACDPLHCVMERVNKPDTDGRDIIGPLHPECYAVLHTSWFLSAFDSNLQGKRSFWKALVNSVWLY